MSFDNYYPNRKDWRKPYRGSARFDRACRHHGSCGWCDDDRRHRYYKSIDAFNADEKANLTYNIYYTPLYVPCSEYEQQYLEYKNLITDQ